MRLGVAIPCYKYHIPVLKRCLDSIEMQTRKPDEVVVSISSSVPEDVPAYSYSFPVRTIVHAEKKNVAANRNCAADELTTDIVTFIDCDDEMHPQRLEILYDLFVERSPDIILHSYHEGAENNQPFTHYTNPNIMHNVLRRAPTGCAIVEGNYAMRIHHGQATVSKFILSRFKFKDDISHERRDDAIFCGDVLAMPGCQSVYVASPLSKYYESRTGGCEVVPLTFNL